MRKTEPYIIRREGRAQRVDRLPRTHEKFDERFLQELLATHPDLLPVQTLRPDAGRLLCIGREVATHDSGTIDNLYLSSTGYVVVVETKLWRNPQSRREVISQVLDYVKDVVTRDIEWFSAVWTDFCRRTGKPDRPLLDALAAETETEIDEHSYVDRLHHALQHGQVIALVVGDGIETRLQQLVAHLCKESAHLRYSLGLVSLTCYQLPQEDSMLVIPELVQEVEPVERAYVRIELSEEVAATGVQIKSVVRAPADVERVRPKRVTLDADLFYEGLSASVGDEASERVRSFVSDLETVGIEAELKSAALMLKVPDPSGEKLGASLLAIEKGGAVYNPNHGRGQMRRWGWSEDRIKATLGKYWATLHRLDERFSADEGIGHLSRRDFLPLVEVLPKLEAIRAAIEETARGIERGE